MADANIKKVIIPKSELPAVDAADLTYNVRYRIVSEDKNRISHWSKIASLISPAVAPITTYTISVNATDNFISVIWQKGSNISFDIYIKWVGASIESQYSYQYVDTTTQGSYQAVIPATILAPGGGTEAPTKVRVLVQTPTYPKEITASAELFETALTNL